MKRIVFLSMIIFTVIGCSDLDENPDGFLGPEGFVNTPQDLQIIVNGAYGYLGAEELYGRKATLTILLRGDQVKIGDPTTPSRRRDVDRFTMDPTNGMIGEFWPQFYAMIGSTNLAIDAAKSYPGDQKDLEPILGQAHFMRAFGYYHLVRLFGPLPYIDFTVQDPDEVSSITRTPVDEIYPKIIADLQLAKEYLPAKQPFRSIPSKGTAAAYLASVYLTRQQFQKSYEEAKFVIDNRGDFEYDLEPDFQNLFNAAVQDGLKETILSVDFRGLDQNDFGNIARDYLAPLTGPRGSISPAREGWSVAVVPVEVFNSFDDNDYRKEVSFITEMVDFDGKLVPWQEFDNYSRGVENPCIAKYYRFPGESSNNGRDSDYNYATMRYAEVLLIAAEALNEISGPTAEAYGYVNQVRARARNTPNGVSAFPEDLAAGFSQDQFRDAVLEERRIELAFEFKRWYDQLRTGNFSGFQEGGFDPQPNFDISRDLLLPIPEIEINNSPNITQNPGY